MRIAVMADIHSNVFDYSGGKIRRKTVDMTQEDLDLNADIIIKGGELL